ncbi:hypothetical protein, partial [Akkermansia sp.]|uniref:hypothetical protein n=1 Tax=Akkermansia sp. TaxID=1872421 RepID=UPI0025C3AAD8
MQNLRCLSRRIAILPQGMHDLTTLVVSSPMRSSSAVDPRLAAIEGGDQSLLVSFVLPQYFLMGAYQEKSKPRQFVN